MRTIYAIQRFLREMTARERTCAASRATAQTIAVITKPDQKLSEAMPARKAAITVMTAPARNPFLSEAERLLIFSIVHCLWPTLRMQTGESREKMGRWDDSWTGKQSNGRTAASVSQALGSQ